MLLSVTLLGVAVATTLPLRAGSEQVKIAGGTIEGSVEAGVSSFKGIPYAEPPVGDLRWRPPQPVKPWTGVKATTAYGHDCAQLPFPGDAAPLGTPPAEDCLVLNVWRPAERTTAKLPVMVWIYGGGFVNGGSSPAVYDGSQFAKRGVVLVSFNYRVGRFGFFGHPALTKESKDGLLGNYGHMDQIAAMKWVQANIAAFGGDPNNVTVFGESAGGMSVLMLLTSPLAKGLFHKAIVESGGGRSVIFPDRHLSKPGANGVPSAEAVGVEFAKANGITGDDATALAALRALPADKVVAGLNMAAMMTPTYSGPMIDGKVVVEPVEAALEAGRFAKVPVIAGANSADIGFSMAQSMEQVFAPFGEHAAKARQLYDPDKTRQGARGRDAGRDGPHDGRARALHRPIRRGRGTAGVSLPLLVRRRVDAQGVAGRPARHGDSVRVRHGAGALRADPRRRRQGDRRDRQRVLGGVCQDRGPERPRPAGVARLQGRVRRDPRFHERRGEGGSGSVDGQARPHRGPRRQGEVARHAGNGTAERAVPA